MLDELGVSNARTYIASGNAIVDVPDEWEPADFDDFDRAVEHELESRFGFQREVVSRSIDELVVALAEHPFRVDNPAWSYVTFLSEEPATDNRAIAAELATGNDEWTVFGHHLHLRYSEGMSSATLKIDTLMKRLDVVGTARNLRTVQAIINLTRR